eukprot:6248487-Pyramimonas_sp.AAC.3
MWSGVAMLAPTLAVALEETQGGNQGVTRQTRKRSKVPKQTQQASLLWPKIPLWRAQAAPMETSRGPVAWRCIASASGSVKN